MPVSIQNYFRMWSEKMFLQIETDIISNTEIDYKILEIQMHTSIKDAKKHGIYCFSEAILYYMHVMITACMENMRENLVKLKAC